MRGDERAGAQGVGSILLPPTHTPAEAPPPPLPVPPSILGEERNVSVVANASVVLECQSHAVPPPVLSWRKDGRPLEPRPGARLSADGALLQASGAEPGGLGAGRGPWVPCEAPSAAWAPQAPPRPNTQGASSRPAQRGLSLRAPPPPTKPAGLSACFPLLVPKLPRLWALKPRASGPARQGSQPGFNL